MAAATRKAVRWPPSQADMTSPEGAWGLASSPITGDTTINATAATHVSSMLSTPPRGGRAATSPHESRLSTQQPQQHRSGLQHNTSGVRYHDDIGEPSMLHPAADPDAAPRVTAPPPLDTDIFQFDDLDVNDAQVNALTQAAMQTARMNAALIATVNRLTVAARQQHADVVAISQRQRKDAERLEAAWHVAADVREDSAAMSVALDRHMRGTDEVHALLQLESKKHSADIRVLKRRLHRAEQLLRTQATEHLTRLVSHGTMRRYFTRWRNRGKNHVLMTTVLRHTSHGVRAIIFAKWRRWLALQKRARACFRQLEYVEDKNNRVVARRFLHKWLGARKRRAAARRVAVRLAAASHRTLAFVAFARWMKAAAQLRGVRRRLEAQFAHCGTMAQRAREGLLRRTFATWIHARLDHAKLRQKRRIARIVGDRLASDTRRRVILRWMHVAWLRRDRRKAFVGMVGSNAGVVMRKYFGRWHAWRWQRWVVKTVTHAVEPVEQKVDIGLRTTSNTNETIQRLIEHFQQLATRVEDMRVAKVSHHQLQTTAFRETSERPPLYPGAGDDDGGASSSATLRAPDIDVDVTFEAPTAQRAAGGASSRSPSMTVNETVRVGALKTANPYAGARASNTAAFSGGGTTSSSTTTTKRWSAAGDSAR